MPRTKIIELDGAKFVIAPLTLAQVEAFLEKQRKALEAENRDELRDIWRDVICAGLNNAERSIDPTVFNRWTPEVLINEIDLVTFQLLREEMLTFSGLKSEPEEKKTESAAAAAS